jgi:hypothetical protein
MDIAAPIMTAIIIRSYEILRGINYVHSYHELQTTDAFWEDGIEAYSHNNMQLNFGCELCDLYYSKMSGRVTQIKNQQVSQSSGTFCFKSTE